MLCGACMGRALELAVFIELTVLGPVCGRLSIEGDHLVLSSPIAKLRDGERPVLDIPVRAKVLIDVGTHRDSTFLLRLQNDPAAWVIGFEADYLHYAHHVVKHSHPRMIMVNAAVGDSSRGWSTFYRWAYMGKDWRFNSGDATQLGSLLRAADWGKLEAHEEMQVAVVPLRDILILVPDRVQILKVDAQGADLEVVKSAGDQIERIDRIVIELPYEAHTTTYSDQHDADDAEGYLESIGFHKERCWSVSHLEQDCAFARPHVWMNLPSEFDCFPRNRSDFLFEAFRDNIDHVCRTRRYGCANSTPSLEGKRLWISIFCCSRPVLPVNLLCWCRLALHSKHHVAPCKAHARPRLLRSEALARVACLG